MEVNVIEKQCLAKTGISIKLNNSECVSIKHVADVVINAVEKTIDETKKKVVDDKQKYKQATDVPVVIDLNTAMRIAWLLGKFIINYESKLFDNVDKMSLATLAIINGEQNELIQEEPF